MSEKESPRKKRGFREELLLRLPTLSYHSLTVESALDIKADLGTIVDLDADAMLEPLEPKILGER